MDVVRKINALRFEADTLLSDEIEREMRRVIKRPSISCVVKGMGVVVVFDVDGNSFDVQGEYASKPPKFCDRLYYLAEMDREYFSLTGRPLRISKKTGSIEETREWG